MQDQGHFYFEYWHGPGTAKVSMELSPDSDLDEVCQAFEQFLLGAGYSFTGRVEIVNEESK
jgi:hypothetical protein